MATADSDTVPALDVITHGCRLNAEEEAGLRLRAAEAGLDDAVIVNSCAVTAAAVRTARQAVRRAARERPGRPVIVTGCAAQTDPQTFSAMPEVARVVGNADKLRADSFKPGAPRIAVSDIFKETAAALPERAAAPAQTRRRARAFLQVQNGCDHRCTFCVIPFGRGNSRSVPADEVVGGARRLVEAGHREVVLTGVDLTSWGGDLEGRPALGDLVQRILADVPELPSLRLSSIDAVEIDPALFEALGERRLAPYLHLSLQHGHTLILKRMKRRHSAEEAEALCAALRGQRPDLALGADLIAGFPTETDAHHAANLAHIEACGLAFTHIFPFSPRAGTPAARMPRLPPPLVKARAAELREAGAAALARHLERYRGRVADALAETETTARLPDFTRCRLTLRPDAATVPMPGSAFRVRITGHDGQTLTGEPA